MASKMATISQDGGGKFSASGAKVILPSFSPRPQVGGVGRAGACTE